MEKIRVGCGLDGGIAGCLAGVLIKGYGFGIVGNIIIGILGAGVAGILAPSLRRVAVLG